MKLRLLSLLALVATLGAVACSDDPTDDGRGEPFAIVTDRTQITVPRNTSTAITAYTIDRNNRRIPGALTGSLAGGGTVSLDSTIYVQELSETRFFVRGTAALPTGADLTITGPSNLTATTHVIVQ
jgi:hypothetical protein